MAENTSPLKSPGTTAPAEDDDSSDRSTWFVYLRGKRLWLLIWLIVLIVLGLNVWVYFLFRQDGKTAQFFESSPFKALLASLLIPLLASAISRAFKIDELRDAERKQLEQEKRKRQTETIAKTNAVWSELYSLSTDVAYFKPGQGKLSLRETRKKIECLTSSAEEMLSLWYLHFPEIALEIQGLVLPGLNLLLLSALTVADMVEEQTSGDSADAAKKMQNCLLVIQDGVRYGLHYSLMQTFYLAMEGNKFELENLTTSLRGPGALFKYLLGDQHPNLPSDNLAQAAALARAAYLKNFVANCAKPKAVFDGLFKKIAQTPDPKKKRQITESDEFKQAMAAYQTAHQATGAAWQAYQKAIQNCPTASLGLARKQIFSPEQIEGFTRELFFQADIMRLQSFV